MNWKGKINSLTIMTKNLKVSINIIHSPLDDAISGEAKVRTKAEAIKVVLSEVRDRMQKKIPDDYACSIVIADKIEG